MKRVRLALVGLGNVGRRFLKLLLESDDTLKEKYGLAFSLHCVVDSSGVAVSEDGFDLARLVEHKGRGLKLCELPEFCEGVRRAGLCRALTSDLPGAIEDFEAYVAGTSNDERRSQRQGWIDALRRGENPFTPEVLRALPRK